MAHTNSTTNYGLPQWIGSDKPTFLGDFNSAFNTIDTQMKSNADTASGAAETASSANATAISANETAIAADGKATLAKNTADAATSAAQSASDLATVAKNTADNAAHAAQGNNIANLAPPYDETRTYSVGELVTYVDENNTGKLYKCIVAWNTPGAFNINYWDDVTVSYLYGTHVKRVLTQTSGVKWNAFLKNTLFPLLATEISALEDVKRATLTIIEPITNNTHKYVYELVGTHENPDCYVFTSSSKAKSSEMMIYFTIMASDDLDHCHVDAFNIAPNQSSYVDPGTGEAITDNAPVLNFAISSFATSDYDREFILDVYK